MLVQQSLPEGSRHMHFPTYQHRPFYRRPRVDDFSLGQNSALES